MRKAPRRGSAQSKCLSRIPLRIQVDDNNGGPCSPSAAAILTVVVVFPTPPFG